MDRSVSLSLKGICVLVTRPKDQAAQLVEKLESLGAAVYIVPAVETEPLPEPQGLKEALGRIQGYHFIVFTSVNGVYYFLEHLERVGLSALHLPPALCVGPKTADAWLQAGGGVDLVPERFSAEELIRALGEDLTGKKFLVLRPERVKTEFGRILRERGGAVDEIVLYRTIIGGENADRLIALLSRGGLDAVLFASPSAVEGFVRMAGDHRKIENLLAVCIGPVTAQAALEHGMKKVVSPDVYTIEGMVEILVSAADELRGRR